ncbi:MAG: Asp23/Gls24 family envelope stress response protein [Bacilli bacterium]|nr:Asp23/Gls24 family envelope stress response protein [Bacilli bacterium]
MARKTEEINLENIINIAAEAALNCYGVVAIANKKADQDQKSMKGKAEEGIFVKKKAGGTFVLDAYIILAQGIKVTEALRECQKAIKYQLGKKFPKKCLEVNVFVLDISAK